MQACNDHSHSSTTDRPTIQLSRASFNIPVKPSACPAGFREALIAQLDVHWADASFASDGRLTVHFTAGPPLTG